MSIIVLGMETGVEEMWQPISGYEYSYEISNFGRVRNKRNGRILKPYFNDKGYLSVKLFCKNKGKHKRVHRLVAEAFIPNIGAKPQVNHIDHNKKNNAVWNLEWVTPQENTDHEIRSGTNKTRNSQLRSNQKYRNGKVQLTCLISPEMNERLISLGLKTGMSRTRIIREALDKHLAEGD